MNFLKRYRLKKRQEELANMYSVYRDLQGKYGRDEYFSQYAQHEMDALAEKCEYIRCILEGRWNK